MNSANETPGPGGAPSGSSLEQLPAAVAGDGQKQAAAGVQERSECSLKGDSQSHDFRGPKLLSPRELSRLRSDQEAFISALAAQLSLHLRSEFSVKLIRLEILAYQTWAARWVKPSCFTLFKLEPLRGVSVLEIPPRLGLAMVDRLMGGPGSVSNAARELSEIDQALLDQIAQLILGEWCGHWSKLKKLKPVLLGRESHGGFVQAAAPETPMLALAMEARFGDCVEVLRLGFPCSSLDPLIRRLTPGSKTFTDQIPRPVAQTPPKWNSCFDSVCVPLTAECHGLELTAREVLALKVGDVLPMDPQSFQHVRLRLAELPKFKARLGTLSGHWAVELSEAINRADPL